MSGSFRRRAVAAARDRLFPCAQALRWLAGKIDPWTYSSCAQEGEDRVLARFIGPRRNGYYVDVGAFDPVRFSNTWVLYQQGWHGINIEPSPDGAKRLQRLRPNDITLNVGVAGATGTLQYHVFNDQALNTFDAALAAARSRDDIYRIVARKMIPVERLVTLLERHVPPGQAIDLLSVDVEGLDLEVLKSSDWSRFRPAYVLAEALGFELDRAAEVPLPAFMAKVGYRLVAKTMNTLFFRRSA